jgi:putative acetyltransferase
MMRIVPGDLGDPRVIDLVLIHLKRARAETAPGSAHALDLTALQSPDICFWTTWDDEVLLGFGALKRLSADHGEVKSMHTVESERGKGIGSALIRYALASARERGLIVIPICPFVAAYIKKHVQEKDLLDPAYRDRLGL